MQRLCRNCSFWWSSSLERTIGDCRRYAPHPFHCALNEQSSGPFSPSTAHDFWCGEFQPRQASLAELLVETDVRRPKRRMRKVK